MSRVRTSRVRMSRLRRPRLRSVVLAALLGVPAALVGHAAPAAAALPAFRCANVALAAAGPVNFAPIPVTAVRVGLHPTFDRFVIQFRGRRTPSIRAVRQPTARFVQDPSGRVVRLLGNAGVRLVMQGTSAVGSYRGPRTFVPRFPELREARQIGDFEAVYSWGLGVARPACLRVFRLQAPSRLVVDLRH